ncbi:MAG: protein translocase subunit SecF [Ignavibacteriaceae bacterium]|nr:protein translocase subunit SecF [Ignavibacteriaceae bacterium]HRI46858.1 protein translocase subunit SecF [Ignavibacteriaceae bacterium]
MRLFQNLNIDFLSKRKLFYILSLAIFVIGLINVVFRGLEFGIDFKGGSEVVLQFEKAIEISDVRSNLTNIGLGDLEIKTFGDERGALIRTELQEIPSELYPKVLNTIDKAIEGIYPSVPKKISEQTVNSITYTFDNPDTASVIADKLFLSGFQAGTVSEEVDNKDVIIRVGISDWIKENLKEKLKGNSFQVLREDRVGPKVGAELKQNALLAIFFSLVVILIYLGFRFKFIFAFGAVAALFHDVLITLGLYALLYDVIPGLNLEISLTIVAAFLTLIGYSINDTVIVFDRVRETLKLHKNGNIKDLINQSINRTMSRTILTGGTTLLTVLVLMIFGGEVLRAFAFTLFFGIIIGTYSSIFVASAFVYDYAEKYKKKLEF